MIPSQLSTKMAREEISLRLGMGRLEIEPIKLNKSINEENPFTPKSQEKKCFLFKQSYQLTNNFEKCSCSQQRKTKSVTIFKKKPHKVLREPILKLSKYIVNQELGTDQHLLNQCDLKIHNYKSDNISLKTLVDNCNQLSISSGNCRPSSYKTEIVDKNKWWKNDVMAERQAGQTSRESGYDKSLAGSCSQQALNPPCDVTIDELASYFETLVHIPKKMSSMAEMMYI